MFPPAAILYINEIPDRIWDERAGKRTLVARLPRSAVLFGYLLLVGAAYLTVLIGVVTGSLAPASLIALASRWPAQVVSHTHTP